MRARMLVLGCLALIAQVAEGAEGSETRGYYVGTVGEKATIQMDLSLTSGSATGIYTYDGKGKPLRLQGKVEGPGALAMEEFDGRDRKTGAFAGGLREEGALEGIWTSPDGKRTMPFRAAKVAEYLTVDLSQGDRFSSKAIYPRFLSPSLEPINKALREGAEGRARQFVKEGLEAKALTKEDFGQWHQTVGYSIATFSPDLISLSLEVDSYSGGAHGNLAFSSANFWIKGGKAQALRLADLFRGGSSFLDVLSGHCLQDLRKQEASRVVEGEVTSFNAEDLRAFTLTTRGVEIAFEPYAVGCYAEGPYHVTVPYAALAKVIRPEGPLGRFLGKR